MTLSGKQLKANRLRLLAITTVVVGAFLGVTLRSVGWIRLPKITMQWERIRDPDDYRPATVPNEGDEIALIYIGSSNCVWSNDPALPELIKNLKLVLADRAETTGLDFTAVGVARDMVATDGISHLHRFGAFDEIMSGRGWDNTGVQKYIYDALPGPAATPQVIVVRRTRDTDRGWPEISDEWVLTRKLGLRQIGDWVSQGAPLGFDMEEAIPAENASAVSPPLDPDVTSGLATPPTPAA